MTLPRRHALLAWAEQNNAAIIEDDYDSEFRFGGRPLEPLQTLDAKGRVVYVGSFSKSMLPTLRLGFPGDAAIAAGGPAQGEVRERLALTDAHAGRPRAISSMTAGSRATSVG